MPLLIGFPFAVFEGSSSIRPCDDAILHWLVNKADGDENDDPGRGSHAALARDYRDQGAPRAATVRGSYWPFGFGVKRLSNNSKSSRTQ
jgi:hypothetical protein